MSFSNLYSFENAVHLILHQLSGVTGQALLKALDAIAEGDLANALVVLRRFKLAPRAVDALQVINAINYQVGLCEVEQLKHASGTHKDLAHIAKQLAWMNQQSVKIIAWNNPFYPEMLKQIPQPPAFLYLQGNISLLHYPQIAMVGARKATPVGLKTAYQLAQEMGRAGFAVTSGLARGIDAQCHRGALDINAPTVAVLGTGIDVVYPKAHDLLTKQISQHGLLISELPLGSEPKTYHFPRRNRILSGLSLGVLVVEASQKSGSLITAKCALEQGREVFAVPGSIHNQMAYGCHSLIKEGATLVHQAEDVLESLSDLGLLTMQLNSLQVVKNDEPLAMFPSSAVHDKTDVEKIVLSHIEDQGTCFDDIVEASGIALPSLREVLLELECQTKIQSKMGRYFKI